VANPSRLGEALKRRRLERNLTLEQLSAGSGVSRTTISKIERGDSRFERPPIPVNLVVRTAKLMPSRVRAFVDFAVPRLAALGALERG
jgi:transcriptional regulator with XRE-family HTH domain